MKATLSTLLLCSDAQALCNIDRIFNDYEIETDVCLNAASALESVKQRKFDLMVLDFDLPGLDELLEYRPSDLWGYPAIVIALTRTPEAVRQALSKRVHFVVQKPFTPDLMGKTLRAAYSLIVKEKRTAFRHSVRINATAHVVEHGIKRPLRNPMLVDISYTGLCIKSETGVPKESTIFIDFQLPDTHEHINAIGKVMWSDAHGQAGVQFRFIAPEEFKTLRSWLGAKCPWDTELMPRSVLSQMAATEASRVQ